MNKHWLCLFFFATFVALSGCNGCGGPALCNPDLPAGEPNACCGWPGYCGNGTDLACVDGGCRPTQGLGEYCGLNNECDLGLTCAPRGEDPRICSLCGNPGQPCCRGGFGGAFCNDGMACMTNGFCSMPSSDSRCTGRNRFTVSVVDPVTQCADGVISQQANTAEDAMACVQELLRSAGTDGQVLGVSQPLRHFDVAMGSMTLGCRKVDITAFSEEGARLCSQHHCPNCTFWNLDGECPPPPPGG